VRFDILILTWERQEYTKHMLTSFLANTSRDLVNRVFLHDDASEASKENVDYFSAVSALFPRTYWERPIHRVGSPVTIQANFARRQAETPYFIKLDSDVILHRGWLQQVAAAIEKDPTLDNVGIEPMHRLGEERDGGVQPCEWISGLGAYRTENYIKHAPPQADGIYFGLEDWMVATGQKSAWLDPCVPNFLLDRVPVEPWASLSDSYVAKGWQRPWEKYNDLQKGLYEWWLR
jgi:hypothetical protein